MFRGLIIVALSVLALFWFKKIPSIEESTTLMQIKPLSDSLRIWYERDPREWPIAAVDEEVVAKPLGPVPSVQYPSDNPYHPRKEALGRQLFFDPILSDEGDIACASCHNPKTAWTDTVQVSKGHQGRLGRRNSMTILNSAYHNNFFWDGRAASLEEQALMPIQDSMEMNGDMVVILERLNASPEYRTAFRDIMGTDLITTEAVSKALATFERSLTSSNSRFDRFWAGAHDQLNDQELLGLHLFRTKAKCMNCHHGPLFTDFSFHNDGFTFFGRRGEDLGRYDITHDTSELGAFKTPSLREVVRTAPYMHTGTMPDLNEVMDMYNQGMPQPISRRVRKTHKGPLPKSSPLLAPLHLSEYEKQSVIAFLRTLSSSASNP